MLDLIFTYKMSYCTTFAPFHKVDMSSVQDRCHLDSFLEIVINYCTAKLGTMAEELTAPELSVHTIDTIDELSSIIDACNFTLLTGKVRVVLPVWILKDMLRFELVQPVKNTTVIKYIISLIQKCK